MKSSITFLVVWILMNVIRSVEAAPATRPVVDYSREEYRLVSRNDEVVTVLRNGATVIAKRIASPVVSVRGYVGTGGVYEGKWLGGGLSHLLEHLVAGGSCQRRTEEQNSTLLQAIGNNSNAYTSEDHTAYFVNTTAPHMEQAVDLVTGWMLGALITPEEYRREYQVVQRELEMGKGEPDRQFWYLSAMNRYRVNPARVPVIGYQAVIQGLSRNDVYNYYKQAYQPNNMIFSVAGDLDPEQMVAAVRKHLKDAPPGRVFSHDIPAEPPVTSPRSQAVVFPKLGQAKLELAFPSIRIDHPDLYAMDLLATILGSGESSILVQEIRDRRELVSSVIAGNETPSYVDGTFVVVMELDPGKIAAATDAVLAELEKIKTRGVDAQRLQRAKTQMRAARVKGMQTAEDIAASLATDYMTTGDPHFSDLYLQRIEKVTSEQIQRVAKKYLDRQRLLTTTMLPEEFVGAKGLPRAVDVIRQSAPTAVPATQPAAHDSKVQRIVLDNGTILLLKRITTTPLVSINMYSVGGVTTEAAGNNGIGNMAMEMLPRGTKTRSADQIAEFFDSTGGNIDTKCGNNTWSWVATCMKEDLPKTLEVYADIVSNPAFPEVELAAMKQRVLAGIAGEDAEWMPQAMRFFKKEYFGPLNSPYQFLPIGTKENVTKLTGPQLRQWYEEKILKSPRRILAIYGDIDSAQVKQLAEKYLGSLPKTADGAGPEAPPVDLGKADGVPSIQITRVQVQKTQQPLAGVVIGFDSWSVIGSSATYPIDVAQAMASGWGYPTGYLHQTLRGRGLVYMVFAQNVAGRNAQLPGNFIAYAGCEPGNINEVVDLILQNIARLQGKDADLQPEWFARSKNLIVTADAMENETPAQQAATAGLDELLGLGYDFHDRFAGNINKVELKDVQGAARTLLRKCVITISTPEPELVKAQPGLRTYESFPPVEMTPRGVSHDSK